MKKYKINYTLDAIEDMDNTYRFIAERIMSPDTAIDYYNGIYDTIHQLTVAGGSIAINPRESIQRRYGPDARTVAYKKMTVVFNVIDDIVLVRRVIAGSLIL